MVATILGLLGGLAIFLYGMSEMNRSIQRASGNRLERALSNMSENKFKGILLGLVITSIVQSSSASTVMVVGLVNSSMLTLAQATNVIIGANIGTTVTAWILSVAGIDSNNIFLSLFKPASLGFIFCIVGTILLMFTKSRRKKQAGALLVSLGLIFVGLTLMSDAMEPIAENESFREILVYFSNPFLGFLAGLLICCVIQSSSASVGILQALVLASSGDTILMGAAVPLILGMHVGTCITAMLSSIGSGVNARRAALVHLYFNIINSVVLLLLFVGVTQLFFPEILTRPITTPLEIAIIHTSTSLIGAFCMIPFSKQLIRLAVLSVPEKQNEDLKDLPDEKFLNSTVVALGQSRKALQKMAELARENILDAMRQIKEYSPTVALEIEKREELIDTYEDKVGTYLVKICESDLGAQESREAAKFLHIIGDFERISDHAVNIQASAEEINDKKVDFSEEAQIELSVIIAALQEIVDITIRSFLSDDTRLALQAEPLEEVIDQLKAEILNNHIDRLQTGECSIKNGFVLSDLLTNFERVSDHCSNVAACTLRADQDFEFHEYLSQVRENRNRDYLESLRQYEEKYLKRIEH